MWFIKKNSYPYPLKLEMNEDQIWKKKKTDSSVADSWSLC